VTEPERLHVLCHELRSPVAALEALAAAAGAVTTPTDRRRLVELAVAAGRDVERLVSDPDVVSLRLERVDVGALARTLEAPGVTVAVHGAPHARADPTRLRQALANLVGNGLRHGSNVAIEVGEEDARVVVDATDDGPGLDSRLDPFAPGSSGVGSTGIGLWLARAIAVAHGGSLEAVGEGPGARFRLCLPRASGED
jgi:signal transduction histidine kinase